MSNHNVVEIRASRVTQREIAIAIRTYDFVQRQFESFLALLNKLLERAAISGCEMGPNSLDSLLARMHARNVEMRDMLTQRKVG